MTNSKFAQPEDHLCCDVRFLGGRIHLGGFVGPRFLVAVASWRALYRPKLPVVLFFGVVAVTGSYFVQVQELPWQAFGCAVPVGLLASAILVVNNVRDIDTDRRAGKRTLAVRLGRERTRALYTAMVAGAFVSAPVLWALGMSPWLLLSWAAIPLAMGVVKTVRTRVDGPALNGALAKTGMLQLLFCVLFAAGILASGGI